MIVTKEAYTAGTKTGMLGHHCHVSCHLSSFKLDETTVGYALARQRGLSKKREPCGTLNLGDKTPRKGTGNPKDVSKGKSQLMVVQGFSGLCPDERSVEASRRDVANEKVVELIVLHVLGD